MEKDYGAVNFARRPLLALVKRGGDIVVYSCDPNGVSDPKPVK